MGSKGGVESKRVDINRKRVSTNIGLQRGLISLNVDVDVDVDELLERVRCQGGKWQGFKVSRSS